MAASCIFGMCQNHTAKNSTIDRGIAENHKGALITGSNLEPAIPAATSGAAIATVVMCEIMCPEKE